MKKILIAFFILAVTVITAGTMFNHTVESLLKKVKISEDEAQNQIFYNISSPANVYFPNLKELKSIALNERPEIVQLVFKRIKSFTATPEFMARYNEYREMKKPSPPEEPQSADDMKEQQIKQMKESLVNMEELKKTMPDQAAVFEETIQSMKQQIKEIENPENQTYTMMAQYMQ